MRRDRFGLLLALTVCALAACVPEQPRPAGIQPERVASSNSTLAKVRPGMSFDQVVTILGPPTSQTSRLTAHAFNPFAVGNQGQITNFYYQKVGRVMFAGPNFQGGGTSVIAVEEDAQEPGYPRE